MEYVLFGSKDINMVKQYSLQDTLILLSAMKIERGGIAKYNLWHMCRLDLIKRREVKQKKWSCLRQWRNCLDDQNWSESEKKNNKSCSSSVWIKFLIMEMDSALSKTSRALKILKFDKYNLDLQKFVLDLLKNIEVW